MERAKKIAMLLCLMDIFYKYVYLLSFKAYSCPLRQKRKIFLPE